MAPSPRVWTAVGVAAAIGAITFLIWWGTAAPGPEGDSELQRGKPEIETTLPRGGTLRGSVAEDEIADAITWLTQAPLVRVNRSTDQIEPWLAESWSAFAPSALRRDKSAPYIYTLKLRPNIVWSDGTPFTAEDVLRAFQVNGPTVLGKPLTTRVTGPLEVEITFPVPFAPGLRLLDTVPIRPPASAKETGEVGLGPFMLRAETPGPKGPGLRTEGPGLTTFVRNPHYWRNAPDGKPLPYLDGMILERAPDPRTALQQLIAGQLDFIEGHAEDHTALRRAAQDGSIRLYDLGPGLDEDALWFLPTPSAGKPWLRREEFRLAISAAVNRRAYCDAVYPGACDPIWGPVTPGNVAWFSPELPSAGPNVTLVSTMLAGIGMQDRNNDGMLDDEAGRPVRFTVLAANGPVEKGAEFLRDDLRKVGIGVDLVSQANLRHDAIFKRVVTPDTDPAMNLEFWMHPKPAADWEREINARMLQQASTSDRVQRLQLFSEVQRMFAQHMPEIFLAAPHEYVATSTRVLNATPSRQRPSLLWNAEILAAIGR